MRRDPIFYQMFQRSPALLFDLIGERPANAIDYRFDSVAVKEPKFEIDGVFLRQNQKPEQYISAKSNFRKTQNSTNAYSGNRCCIFIATVRDFRIGKL